MSEPDIILTAKRRQARRLRSPSARASRPILRLAVDGGGCAGFTYQFELGETQAEDDDASPKPTA